MGSVVRYTAMILLKNYFINTTGEVDVKTVLHEVNRALGEANAQQGLVTITVPAPGAGLTIIEPLPDIVSALKEAIKVFPGEGAETRNKRKEEISIAPRVAAAMLGKTISIPLKDGKLALGHREEPVIVDMESKGRRREFTVQVFGEGAETGQQQRGQPMRRR